MGTQPTFWDWLQLGVGLFLFAYALLVFIGDRVPALAAFSTVVRKASVKLFLIFVDRAGGWLERFYIGLFWGAWDVLCILWRGQPGQAAVARPVNRFPPPDLRYVTGSAPLPPQSMQTDPASVCLSADLAPEAPPVPPALLAIMLDSDLDKDARRAATAKESLLAALIAAGWGYSEIRAVLKNDSNTFRAEFDAASARLAAPPSPARQTPLAQREIADGVEFRRQPAP